MVPFLGFNLAETTSALPPRGGAQAQQKPNSVKAPTVEAELKKAQRSRSDKKPTKTLRNLLALRQIAKSTISTASRRQFENKVPEKQKLFQEDNGIPVHLKGGIADALLYRATMILTVGGTAYAMYELAVASFPKKQD
ncbi:cytochrome c oxidase subunit 7A2, mitochondrial-like [Oryx dammah]|uniref:cytochrome c oxidase subunit 7A2, mitochondrial-like n=1 Tax=Oryx dammah TaxID=59534 RepID=UPI001A9B2762|nr:cytochrome c oxidase subunit 7A2, mitochondrial-like [Oryx dammah]